MDDAEITLRLCEILARLPGWDGPLLSAHTSTTQVAIFYGAIAATPDVAVGVRIYDDGGSPADPRTVRKVQLRFRGARGQPAGADRLAGIAEAVFSTVDRVAGINGIVRTSFGPSGPDTNGREQRTDNYHVILDNLEAFPS